MVWVCMKYLYTYFHACISMQFSWTPFLFQNFLIRKGFKNNLKRTKSATKLDRKRAASQAVESDGWVHLNHSMKWGALCMCVLGPLGLLDAPSDWYSAGRWFDPRIRHHLSYRFGHEIISRVILTLPLIQEEHCQLLVKEWALGKPAQEQCG